MSFESDLKAHLQNDAAVSALVLDRIYPGVAPQGAATPRITYTQPFGQPLISLDGYTSGTQRRSIQIDCWATRFTDVIALAQAVFERLNVAPASFAVAITDYPLLEEYEEDTKLFRRSIGASCLYTDRVDI